MRSEGMAKEMPAATLSVLMPMTSPSWRGDRSSGHCARLAVAPLPEALWAAEPPRPRALRVSIRGPASPRPLHSATRVPALAGACPLAQGTPRRHSEGWERNRED